MSDKKWTITDAQKERYAAEASAENARLRTVNAALLEALEEISNHWANSYDHPHANTEMYRGPYGIGVVDGHRACAAIARPAIALVKGERP